MWYATKDYSATPPRLAATPLRRWWTQIDYPMAKFHDLVLNMIILTLLFALVSRPPIWRDSRNYVFKFINPLPRLF